MLAEFPQIGRTWSGPRFGPADRFGESAMFHVTVYSDCDATAMPSIEINRRARIRQELRARDTDKTRARTPAIRENGTHGATAEPGNGGMESTGPGGMLAISGPVGQEKKSPGVPEDTRIYSPGVLSGNIRGGMTLRELYESELRQRRLDNIGEGHNKQGTLDKDVSAIGFWERVTANPPLISVDQLTINEAIRNGLKIVRRGTLKGYANHLRWILGCAVELDILTKRPKFSLPKVSRKTTTPEEFRDSVIYEMNGDVLATLGAIVRAIESQELRVAFMNGASFGPRTEDLLLLHWSAFKLDTERPHIDFVAEKTGTFHRIPLAAWHVEVMRSWRAQCTGPHVFPTLISHKAKQPSKSKAARRTVSTLRAAALSIGFTFDGRDSDEQKPFQVLRATCNERFERHCRRAGEFVLGHGMSGVNRQSYQNPGSEIYDAVNTLPQPKQFLES